MGGWWLSIYIYIHAFSLFFLFLHFIYFLYFLMNVMNEGMMMKMKSGG